VKVRNIQVEMGNDPPMAGSSAEMDSLVGTGSPSGSAVEIGSSWDVDSLAVTDIDYMSDIRADWKAYTAVAGRNWGRSCTRKDY
jgi:hypothetical protein